MTWGVFENKDLDGVHIVPTDKDGVIKPPHELDAFCPCEPDVEEVNEHGARLVIVHMDEA